MRLLDGQVGACAARALIYFGGLADDQDHDDEALSCVRRAIEAARPFGTDLQVAAAIAVADGNLAHSDRAIARERAEGQAAFVGGGTSVQLGATGREELLAVKLEDGGYSRLDVLAGFRRIGQAGAEHEITLACLVPVLDDPADYPAGHGLDQPNRLELLDAPVEHGLRLAKPG